jgi:hypothetical protein
MNYKREQALLNERQALLDRIQAKDLIEYKNVTRVAKIEPKEPKKIPNYL